MLATRVIPVVLARGQQAVKGKAFDSWRSVGHLRMALRVYEMRGVDELVLLDIAATPNCKEPDFNFVRDFASECFFPVAVGGGVRTLEHFRELLANGADKVVVNTAATYKKSLLVDAAKKFGSQAVVVSIDVKWGRVVTDCGQCVTNVKAVDWAREVAELGAGEILLNSIDRDGTLSGYDLDLVQSVSGAVDIPVVACGGAGNYHHMLEAIKAGAHAVAASAIWHFTDATPAEAAEYLHANGVAVRRKLAA